MSGSNSSNPAEPIAAEPIQLSVHSMPRLDMAAEDAQRRAGGGRWKLLLILLVCAAPVIASYLTYYVIRPQGRSNYATLIEPAREMPAALPLQDLQGRAVSPGTLRGQWLIVVVAPAACDTACEKRLFAQRQLREMTGRERERIDKLWLVTDKAPIKPELLSALAATPATQVLRVPAADLSAWLEGAPGESLDSHLYLVDPMGRWMMRAPVQLDPAKFKRDIDRVLRASASWDTPGR
jgi:hypothetical protein